MKHLVPLALLAACGGGSSRQHVSFAKLSFDVPSDWTSSTEKRRGLATETWTPEDNGRRESVVVIRSELAPQVAHAGGATIERLLAGAQADLGAKPSAVMPVSTASGLTGMRIDLDYVPPGQRDHYHRVHCVLVDGDSLVHVLYTARAADENLTAFNLVLSTLREGEG